MILIWIPLWIIAGIILWKDYRTESTIWAAAVAFWAGLGGLSVFLIENLLGYWIYKYNIFNNTINCIYAISIIMSSLTHYIGPYCVLMYGVSYANIVPKKRKLPIYALLFVPVILSFIFIPCENQYFKTPEETMTYFRELSIWAFPYMIIGNFFLVYSYFNEKSWERKKNKLFTILVVVPFLTYSAISNYLLRCLGVDNNWRFFSLLVPIEFAGFLYFAKKYGVMGVKLKFERYKFAFDNILDHISDSFIACDENYEVIEVNKMFLENFSTQKKYKYFEEIIDNSSLAAYKNDLKNMVTLHKKIEIFIGLNEKRCFEVEVKNIEINNIFFGMIYLFKDITEHKRNLELIEQNQRQLIENERLIALSQLVAGVAHNLKTPLLSSSGGVDITEKLIAESVAIIKDLDIEDDTKNKLCDIMTEDIVKWQERIKGYLTYMNDVINTLKAQTVPLATGSKTVFTLRELANTIKVLMSHESQKTSCSIEYSVEGNGEFEITGEMNYLVQVINNLISNAIYACEDDKRIFVKFVETGSQKINIIVRDTGKGIPEELKELLFNKMITTKGKDGSGLGLYISRSIIASKFAGEITFESEVGKGSTFVVTIPVGGNTNGKQD